MGLTKISVLLFTYLALISCSKDSSEGVIQTMEKLELERVGLQQSLLAFAQKGSELIRAQDHNAFKTHQTKLPQISYEISLNNARILGALSAIDQYCDNQEVDRFSKLKANLNQSIETLILNTEQASELENEYWYLSGELSLLLEQQANPLDCAAVKKANFYVNSQ